MGGKSSTSTQALSVPQSVLDRYQSVNNTAQQTAAKPFQSYSSDPSAFVAQLNDTQNQGIAGTNAAANMAQPYYALAGQDITKGQSQADPLNAQAGQGFTSALAGAQPYNQGATGLALAGAQAVNPTDLDASSIQKYISPYLNTVLGSTSALLNQNNQQQQAGQLGSAITSGAFGGDRAGIAAANLAQQQNLGNASIYSGILNDAYGQALTTAQNQQSLGLGAAQANRAALSGAAGQIQSIGQQGYEQGTGTAAAQQGLGQQVFNQGITASDAQSGLGTAAQSAALQGAQAQLAAGQLQQQTDQAGKTALYNQFLQQQSYPFQVSQFLANIAEGTGSLSGSTTTTTQPGSLFSDRRVKDDIRKVGKTFDGQTIYTFKYKGDDTTHIGLMAQDVEKKHPDAVGLSSGIKTVNYEKATDDAADRGKFKRGGLALVHEYANGGSTGFDPETTQRLLMTAQGMYGGLGAGGTGVYGGAAGRVPTASLPVGELKTAGPLPQQPSGLAQAAQFADLAANGAKGYDWIKGKMADNDDDSASALARDLKASPYQRGGLASGGMPYSDGLDIPDEQPQYKLQTAPPLGKASSTGDDLKTVADIAKTAAMFMNQGGLAKRYASGGSPDFDMFDPNFYDAHAKAPQVTAAQMRAFTGGNNSAPNFDESGLSYGVKMPDIGSPNFDETGATFKDTSPNPKADAAGLAPTAADMHAFATKPAPRGLAAPADDHWPEQLGAGLAQKDTAQPSNVLGAPVEIAAPDPASINLNTQGPDAAQFAKRSPLADIGDSAGNVIHGIAGKVTEKGGYLDRLFHGDEKTLVPFLAGLGAFTAAPTRDFGTALAQGLSAGAQTYPKLQQMELERAKTAAGVKQTEASTAKTNVDAYNIMQQKAQTGYQAVPGVGPHGEQFTAPDGKPWHYELQVNQTNFGAPVEGIAPIGAVSGALTPSQNTDETMRSQYKIDPNQPGVANRARLIALNPALGAQDDAAAAAAQKRIVNLGDVDSNHRQILQLGQAINKLSDGSLTGQGADFARRAELANVYNTALGMVGLPKDPTVTSDLEQSQIIDKIRTLVGTQLAHSNDEKAASIAHALTNVLPGGGQQKGASNEVLGSMMVANQQQRDFPQYYNAYTGKYGVSLNAEPSFQHDMGAQYDREQKALPVFMGSGAFEPAMRALHDPNPDKRAKAVEILDAKYGPNFHRYFTGN